MYKVLISDKMSEQASEIFKNRGIDLDVKTGLDESKLISIIDQYDGLAIRSSTKVTKKVLSAAKKLKVIASNATLFSATCLFFFHQNGKIGPFSHIPKMG